MKLLVDASLSPLWCAALKERNVDAVHWSSVGDVRAPDRQILEWARTQDVMPDKLADLVVSVLRQHAAALDRGALVTIDALRARVRVLPIRG